MNISYKGIVVIIVVVVALAASVYTLGLKQGETSQLAAPSTDVMPAAHPAIPDTSEGFTHFKVGNRNVKSILADGPLMWFGTSAGVVRYDVQVDEYFQYNNKNGLLSNGVFYVGKLGDKIAIGTYGGGLSLFDDKTKTWKNYNVPEGLADAFVYEVLEASNGDVWIATWSGANRIRGGDLDDRGKWDTFTVENTDGGLPNDWVYGLAEDTNGVMWLGTEGGLARFEDGKWENWAHKDGLGASYELVKEDIKFDTDPGNASSHHSRQKIEQGLENVDIAYNPNYIISMEVDKNGFVWCGTWGGGLARFDGKTWTNFTMKDGLPSNHIFMLKQDTKGQLWAGTSDGLVEIVDSGKGFNVKTTSDGLFSNNVFSMADAEDGDVWVGSFGGVARLIAPQ